MQLTPERPMSLPTQTRWLLRWSRYLFFCAGILTLSYVGFTLLEARAYQANAMRSLEGQIQMQQEHQVGFPNPAVNRAGQAVGQALKEGDVLGRMEIPRLGMSIAVLQGTNSRILRVGVGHIAGTALPGEAGNTGIAGHRDTFFRELKDIRRNDEIQLQTAIGLFRYQVNWIKVVAPEDTSVLEPSTESTLTLVTCYPFYFLGGAPKRFVVHAQKL